MSNETKPETGETTLADKLAAMSRQTSLAALDAVIRLARESDRVTATRRINAVAKHITAAASDLASNVEAVDRAQKLSA